jgi:hypothetical protein
VDRALCRPLFAEFLTEAAEALKRPALTPLAEQYAELGRAWSTLADLALPDDVALLREAKTLLAHKAALVHGSGPAQELASTWARLAALEQIAAEQFPLSAESSRELRTQLRTQILAIHAREVAAQATLTQLLGEW